VLASYLPSEQTLRTHSAASCLQEASLSDSMVTNASRPPALSARNLKIPTIQNYCLKVWL